MYLWYTFRMHTKVCKFEKGGTQSMDHYLVSVFQNQGLTAVRTMCEQGKQKLSLRNDTLRWAIQHHENDLVNLLVNYTDVHHDGAMPVRLAAWTGNIQALKKILEVPDVGGSATARFEVYVNLINNSNISSTVLDMINTSFSDDVFQQLHSKSSKRVQWYMEIAQWDFKNSQKLYENKVAHLTEKESSKIQKPTIADSEHHQQAVHLQNALDAVIQLKKSAQKPKM